MANLRVRVLVIVVGAWVGSGACGLSHEDEGAPSFAVEQLRNLSWVGWESAGVGCLELTPSESSGFFGITFDGPPDRQPSLVSGPESEREDFRLETSIDDRGLRAVATVNGKTLAQKLFTHEFFQTGEIDRMQVETPLGNRVEVAYRGAKECELDAELFEE